MGVWHGWLPRGIGIWVENIKGKIKVYICICAWVMGLVGLIRGISVHLQHDIMDGWMDGYVKSFALELS